MLDCLRKHWPLMWRSTHEAVRRENCTLRDVLREANAELLKHRRMIVALKQADPRVTDALMK